VIPGSERRNVAVQVLHERSAETLFYLLNEAIEIFAKKNRGALK